jgi:hypothetical protein
MPLALIWPVMAQVVLTIVLILWTGAIRVRVIRRREVRMKDIALSSDAWPDDTRKIANNMRNQFETPVLFYVLCGVAIYVGAAGALMTLLAWAWFASRLVHTAIHVTTNRVPHRAFVFAVGVIILMLMWLLIVFHLLDA